MRPACPPPRPLAGCRRRQSSIDGDPSFSIHLSLCSTGFRRLPRYYEEIRLLHGRQLVVVASFGPGCRRAGKRHARRGPRLLLRPHRPYEWKHCPQRRSGPSSKLEQGSVQHRPRSGGVHRAIQHKRGGDAIIVQPAYESRGFPVAVWHLINEAFALRSPAIEAVILVVPAVSSMKTSCFGSRISWFFSQGLTLRAAATSGRSCSAACMLFLDPAGSSPPRGSNKSSPASANRGSSWRASDAWVDSLHASATIGRPARVHDLGTSLGSRLGQRHGLEVRDRRTVPAPLVCSVNHQHYGLHGLGTEPVQRLCGVQP
jgi:hypothetical protein